MPPSKPNRRWYRITPGRLFIGLLMMQVFLFLSEQCQWFAFNQKKGWTVLIAVGLTLLAILVLLLWFAMSFLFRRRLQLDFRSLLILSVVLSVSLGWISWQIENAKRQKRAVEAILNVEKYTARIYDGSVIYDYHHDHAFWIMCPEEAVPRGPAWLRRLLGDDFFCHVVTVNCCFSEFGDCEARHLRELTNLERLVLFGTQITDDGLRHLVGMVELRDLSVGHNRLTDKALVHVERLTNLRELDLCNTRITDAGLIRLGGLTNLESLDVSLTPVTDEGVKKLQKALPNCRIVR
jgi:hypothetical protein